MVDNMQIMHDLKFETHESVEDQFLDILSKEKIPAYIYLKNGIKLQGFIETFDEEVVVLKNQENQLIYKKSIATIMPTFSVKDIKRQNQVNRPIAVEA